jgi:hypothetical protein
MPAHPPALARASGGKDLLPIRPTSQTIRPRSRWGEASSLGVGVVEFSCFGECLGEVA